METEFNTNNAHPDTDINNCIENGEDPTTVAKQLLNTIQRLVMDIRYFIIAKRQAAVFQTFSLPRTISDNIQQHDVQRINRDILESAIKFKKKKLSILRRKLRRIKKKYSITVQNTNNEIKLNKQYFSRKENKLNKKFKLVTTEQQKNRFNSIVVNHTNIKFNPPKNYF